MLFIYNLFDYLYPIFYLFNNMVCRLICLYFIFASCEIYSTLKLL